jgi:opacity protein-like surface antigen
MIKNLVAGIALAVLLGTPNPSNANESNPDGKLYVEVGGTWSMPSDVDAEFTTENTTANWDLSDMKGMKVQIGSDFGKFRIDAKFQYLEGDVDGISGGVTNVKSVTGGDGPNAAVGVATLNFYADLPLPNKGSENKVTPYLGAGVGLARGFMQAEGTLASVLREDHRTNDGTALAGIAGAFFQVNEKMGLTTEYEYLNVGFGGLSNHSLSVGLRFAF